MLINRLDAVLAEISWEVLFVDDDSPDGTATLIQEIGSRDPRVRCLLRIGRRGLSSAFIDGMLTAESPYSALMDGDLQHDEAILPEMLAALKTGNKEIVIGSRYMEGAGTGEWGFGRVLVSRMAALLSKFLVPKGVTDPMSGFFMIRREIFMRIVRDLSGKGFKILLDLLASADKPLEFVEIPYTFRPRHAGESKLDSNVALEYLELLIEKSIGKIVSVRFSMFVTVGAAGVIVHMTVLGTFNQLLAISFDVAQGLAIWIAMTFNFFLNNLATYRDKPLKGGRIWYGLLTFYAACGLGAIVNFAVAVFLEERGIYWAVAGFSGAVAGAIWNFATTAVVTWGGTDSDRDPG